MGILTEREKEIMTLLKKGESVKEIGKTLEIPMTSVSRSITSIRRKARDIEEDIEFFQDIGYLNIRDGILAFTTPDRDPKALGRTKG